MAEIVKKSEEIKPNLEDELKISICNYLIRLFDKDVTTTNELVQLAKLVIKN